MTTVTGRGVVYLDGDSSVEALGVNVTADAPAHVSGVGWEVESATGSAQVFMTPRSRHPQPPLPYTVPRGKSGCWMMTAEEIRAALVNNDFGIAIDLESATLRPFATINGDRMSASETVGL